MFLYNPKQDKQTLYVERKIYVALDSKQGICLCLQCSTFPQLLEPGKALNKLVAHKE